MEDSINRQLFSKETIAASGDTPVYQRILALIRHHIRSGQLKPGEMLPPESKLCEIYGVSRTTIRLAMDQLAEERLIVRQRGKGSFVETPKLHRNLNHLYSFTKDMESLGIRPSSKVIEKSVVTPPEKVAEVLAIPKDAPVFKLVRVRYADEEPVLYESTFVPDFLCSGIEQEDFSQDSLYLLLQNKYQLKLDRAFETYESVILGKRLAGFLSSSPSAAAFQIHRTGFLENGIAFEYTYSTVRSDKCMFTVELKNGEHQVYFSRKITP